MNTLLVKICGLTSLASLLPVLKTKADLIGFIFVPNTPRLLSVPEVEILAKEVHKAGKKVVAVFQDQPLVEVQAIASAIRADFVQLHGSESPEYCAEVGLPIIKTLKLTAINATTTSLLEAYSECVNYFLLDRLTQGKGKRVNTKVIEKVGRQYPVLLAGGLKPDNIAEIKELTQEFVQGYDVSSGVESSVGVKDAKKVKDFVTSIKK